MENLVAINVLNVWNIKQLIMSRVNSLIYRVPFLSIHSHSTHRSGVTQSCRVQVDLTQGMAGLKARDQAKTV